MICKREPKSLELLKINFVIWTMAAKLKKRALAEYQSQVLTEDAAASSGNCEFNGLWFFIFSFCLELWK